LVGAETQHFASTFPIASVHLSGLSVLARENILVGGRFVNRPYVASAWPVGGHSPPYIYFGYDFLDRLTTVSGAYSQSYSYNNIGNIYL
jgi:hypothetical protein